MLKKTPARFRIIECKPLEQMLKAHYRLHS